MIEIRVVGTGEEFRGRAVESIVRRVWGRNATIFKTDVHGRYEVVTPDPKQAGVYFVHNRIQVYR